MLILVKDSESSSDVKGSLMQLKKVSPKGPSDSKIHCDLLYKNYVRGWVLVDEVPTINVKIAMGFSLVDEKKEIGSGTCIKLKVEYGDSRVEHIEVQSPKELYEIRAISSIEDHENCEVSGWLAILDPTLFGSELHPQTKNGLVQIHIEDRRSDVALMTGIKDPTSMCSLRSEA